MIWGSPLADYLPIELPIDLKADGSDMAALYWRHRTVVADFFIPQDSFSHLRIRFGDALIMRVVDEMAISTEERSTKGLVKDHLAYRVEDSHFWETQSETFRFVHKNADHYRFVSAGMCLDVISHTAPLIVVVPADSGPANVPGSR